MLDNPICFDFLRLEKRNRYIVCATLAKETAKRSVVEKEEGGGGGGDSGRAGAKITVQVTDYEFHSVYTTSFPCTDIKRKHI